MHELGHAHGDMGDEYRTDDDRDVSRLRMIVLIPQLNQTYL